MPPKASKKIEPKSTDIKKRQVISKNNDNLKKSTPAPKNITNQKINIEEEELNEKDYELEEEKFFDKSSYNNFVKKVNIEPLSDNYVVNNDLHKEIIIVPDEQRITSEIMTQAEYARVVGERASQIQNGSVIFIDVKNIHDPIIIAEKEIEQKKCPLVIYRALTPSITEIWRVNEMIVSFK